MPSTAQVQTCIIKGCDGFYVPDITGRPMCYKCGPRNMLPTYYTSDYPQYDGKVRMPTEGLNPVMAGTPDKVAYSSMPVAPPKTSSPPRVEGLKGSKHDIGKAPWHLLPWEEVEEVVKVLQHGAAKYGEFNWMQVPDARKRYFSAAMRHLAAYANGQGRDLMDKESGLSHMSHAVCSILFIMHFERGRI